MLQIKYSSIKWFQRRFSNVSANQKQESSMAALCFVLLGHMRKLYNGPSIDVPYQILFHLAKRFQRRRFLMYHPIRNKNCPWWPCFLSNADEMRKLYKGPSIYAPYKILIHLVKRFQRRRFLMYQPIRNKNRPCFLSYWDKIRKLYKEPSIDAPYQI